MERKPDFSGYATKNDLKCTDGKIIRHGAFKENSGKKVPLVWQHLRDTPSNILGHVILEQTDSGVYAKAYFNSNKESQSAKETVQHGDINQMSIYANRVKLRGDDVIHGNIVEVSLVLAGANPGAVIDYLDDVEHSDSYYEDVDHEVVIYTGLSFEHADDTDDDDTDDDDVQTPEEVFNSMTPLQQTLLVSIAEDVAIRALEEANTNHDEDDDADDVSHQDQGSTELKKNIFDRTNEKEGLATLSHDQFATIQADAIANRQTFNESLIAHAGEYGIQDIQLLFPDATNVDKTPQWMNVDDSWQAGFLAETTHTPFSRIKTQWADITLETARARGHVKGAMKKDEFFRVYTRTTEPTTVYKKQKLDRQDIIDITSYDVVAWIRNEMRGKLNEELALAALLGDGREVDDPDKILETAIRPIITDHDLFSVKVVVQDQTIPKIIDTIIGNRHKFRGTGTPNLYMSEELLSDLLLLKDENGRYVYETPEELARRFRVSKIVPVEQMNDLEGIQVIMVNPKDYSFGADAGGRIQDFQQFDIDYNQEKYLTETRCSGALTKILSAVVFTFSTTP